jgi:hypothetical protein
MEFIKILFNKFNLMFGFIVAPLATYLVYCAVDAWSDVLYSWLEPPLEWLLRHVL